MHKNLFLTNEIAFNVFCERPKYATLAKVEEFVNTVDPPPTFTIDGCEFKTIAQDDYSVTLMFLGYQESTGCKPPRNGLEILDAIRAEIAKPKTNRNSFSLAVFYSPQDGKFLYDDVFYSHEIILPMIERRVLKYKGIKNHQGEKMVAYSI
jgi:hypothetical protein